MMEYSKTFRNWLVRVKLFKDQNYIFNFIYKKSTQFLYVFIATHFLNKINYADFLTLHHNHNFIIQIFFSVFVCNPIQNALKAWERLAKVVAYYICTNILLFRKAKIISWSPNLNFLIVLNLNYRLKKQHTLFLIYINTANNVFVTTKQNYQKLFP